MFDAGHDLALALDGDGSAAERKDQLEDIRHLASDRASKARDALIAAPGLDVVHELIGLEAPIVESWLRHAHREEEQEEPANREVGVGAELNLESSDPMPDVADHGPALQSADVEP